MNYPINLLPALSRVLYNGSFPKGIMNVRVPITRCSLKWVSHQTTTVELFNIKGGISGDEFFFAEFMMIFVFLIFRVYRRDKTKTSGPFEIFCSHLNYK